MARQKREFTAKDAFALSRAIQVLAKHHMRYTENGQGRMVTKLEAIHEIAPDIFIVSGGAKREFRDFLDKMAKRDLVGVDWLEALYSLNSPTPKDPKGER